MEFEAALGQEALGVFARTGFTPSQLVDNWKRELGLYDEVLAQRAEIIAAAIMVDDAFLCADSLTSEQQTARDTLRAVISKITGGA